MRRIRFGAVGGLLMASMMWGGVIGCGGSVTDVPTGLPPQLALRSDTPYIIGTIRKRDVVTDGVTNGELRALPPQESGDAILVWR